MMVRCSNISEAEELFALAPAWWNLWQRSPTATPFQTPAWLMSWWRAFAPGRLNVVAAWEGEALVGLAPLYLDGTRLLPLGISVSDYLDVLIDPERAETAGHAIVDYLARSDAWRTWELCDLPPHACALRLCPPGDCEDGCDRQSICLSVKLPEFPDQVRQSISAKSRRALAQAHNRAARRGTVTLQRLGEQDSDQAFSLLLRLHEACWRDRDRPGVLADPRVRQLHTHAIGPLAARGLVRFHVARIGGEVASIYYGFHHRDRAYGYLTGYNPGFAFESPGTLLLAHVIEESAREGAIEFDFLRGDEGYKRAWASVERWNRRRVFRRSEQGGHDG
jgi:CelD/BcsL family acetyltransferase involved in cellulose biosynthesis